MSTEFSYFYLTCDESQKEQLAQALVEAKLIVCAKFLPVDAMYWWNGAIERATEALVMMEGPSGNFAKIEQEIAKIHSYDTFVLTQVPMENLNNDAQRWVRKELK